MSKSLELEKALIGAVFLNDSVLPKVAESIIPQCFGAKTLRKVYETFLEMRSKNQVIDPLSFQSYLPAEDFYSLGGANLINSCMEAVPYGDRVFEYAEMLRTEWTKREFTEVLKQAISTTESDGVESAATLIQQKIKEISGGGVKNGFEHISVSLESWFEQFEEGLNNPEKRETRYLSTGLGDYDRQFGGLRLGLNILGGRPGMGKSALALTEALNIARRGKNVLIVSIEMPKEEVGNRMIAALSGVNSSRLDRFEIDQGTDELSSITDAFGKLSNLPIYLSSAKKIDEIIKITNDWMLLHERTPDVVFVDYLQLIESEESSQEYRELTQISRRLMHYFKFEAKCPCRLLCQLSRSVESRTDKRPIQSDIRGSGGIEQDADVIDFVYRDDYYNKDTAEEGVTEIIRTKSRQCSTGTVKVFFSKETASFYSLPSQTYDPY